MSVLVEALSVIIRRDAVDLRYPGGIRALERDCPNATFCSDDQLARVGFMSSADVEWYIHRLERAGLRFAPDSDTDICVVDQFAGPTFSCSWLDFAAHPQGYAYCWRHGTQPGDLAAPRGWSPRDSASMVFGPADAVAEPVDEASTSSNDGADLLATLQQAQAALHEYETTGASAALERCRELWDAVADHGAETGVLGAEIIDLAAKVFQHLSELTDNDQDARRAADLMGIAFGLTPAQDEHYAERAQRLGQTLQDLYWVSGNWDDIERAVEAFEAALAAASKRSSMHEVYLNDLATALVDRYSRRGRFGRADLDRAVGIYRELLAGHRLSDAERAAVHNNFCHALILTFEQDGDPAQLEAAIQHGQAALKLTPDDDPDRASRLRNLSRALLGRFEVTDEEANLDQALELVEQSVSAAATPLQRSESQDVLSMALLRRFEQHGDLADLERSLDLVISSVAAVSPSSPDRGAAMSNLGVVASMVMRVGSASVRAAAAEHLRHAVTGLVRAMLEGPRASHGKPGELAALASLLLQLGLGEAAAEAAETALTLTHDPDSPVLSYLLDVHGRALLDCYRGQGDVRRLDQAERQFRAAIDLDSEGPVRGRSMFGLAQVRRERQLAQDGTSAREAVTEAYRAATLDSAGRDDPGLFVGAQEWGDWASSQGSWPEAAEAYAASLSALGSVFRSQLIRRHKETWLRHAIGLAPNAAYAYAATSALQDASLALELGRSVLLSEQLGLHRRDLALLATHGSEVLARRFHAASAKLDQLTSKEGLAAPT